MKSGNMLAEKRQQAFAMFLKFNSLRTIAVELGICRSTCERWSRQDEWVDQRAIIIAEQKTLSLKSMLENSVSGFRVASEAARLNLLEALAESRAFSEGLIPAKARRFKPSQILSLYKLYELGTKADLNLMTALEAYQQKNNSGS